MPKSECQKGIRVYARSNIYINVRGTIVSEPFKKLGQNQGYFAEVQWDNGKETVTGIARLVRVDR